VQPPSNAARFGLPCGGNLRLVQEPLQDAAWIDELLSRTERHELVARRLDLDTGKDSVVGPLEEYAGRIAVSRDGKTILYTSETRSGSDLMLLEGFR